MFLLVYRNCTPTYELQPQPCFLILTFSPNTRLLPYLRSKMEGFTRFLPLSESTNFRHTISQKRLYIYRVREPISAIRFPSNFNISGIRAVRRFPSYEDWMNRTCSQH
ncbi:hypothetical protein L6452_42227 [Arctium lappa]|uniref:Uncharacterized protein n=1 Tax=Arctium lappa TaxID=4217 RepID=A0ACB8XHN5_ARCLA|nr:hypothetical protein L6452_42227 [Arctium lappa]